MGPLSPLNGEPQNVITNEFVFHLDRAVVKNSKAGIFAGPYGVDQMVNNYIMSSAKGGGPQRVF
jgi:hypothetical protein